MNLTSHSQHHDFESLVRRVSSHANVIVPVISLKEIPGNSWRSLGELVASGFKRSAIAVLCTHLDLVSQIDIKEQLSNAFWHKSMEGTARIIPCSSLMGLGAIDLLNKSESEKPPFDDIWDKKYVGYHVSSSSYPKLLSLTINRVCGKNLGCGQTGEYLRSIYQPEMEGQTQ